MPAAYKRVPVKAAHKRLILVVCFAFIVMEHQAGTLFLWPLDHSCARPANLTIFTELFTDSKSQPIDLDAVQRNLFDATPEDTSTMARAASMGIEYDDVARCLEYSVDYQDDNQPVFNMDNLEPCRFGLRFELFTSRMSVIDHYNLACRRQWLKILVPQSFALGLLSGLLLTYFVWYRTRSRSSTRWNTNQTRQVKLIPWRGFNLTAFVVLYLVTLILNQCYLNNSLRDAPLVGGESAELGHRERRYFLFVASIFLRSALVGSMLCRVMMKWRATSIDVNNFEAERNDFHRLCFVSMAIALVVLKISFVPLAMKLFNSWSSLSIFLTLSQMLLLALISMFELLQVQPRLQATFVSAPQSQSPSLDTEFVIGSRDRPQFSQIRDDDDEPLGDGRLPCNLEIDDGSGCLHMLTDMNEISNSTTSDRIDRRQTARVRGFVEPSFKTCEFCSVKDNQIFGIMNQPGGQRMFTMSLDFTNNDNCLDNERTMQIKRNELNQRPTDNDESSRVADSDNLRAYLPTTMPLDRLAYVTAADPIEMRFHQAIGGSRCADSKLPMNALSGLRSLDQNDSQSNSANFLRQTSHGHDQTDSGFPSSIGGLQHNSSLFELNVTRWPLMSKLTLLTFCLTFNYFLMQTIPNHKLQHGESISSLMERKTTHRRAQFDTVEAHQNSSRGLAPIATGPDGHRELQENAIKISGQLDKFKLAESVYDPRLISREQYRAKASESSKSMPQRLSSANLNESAQSYTNEATKRSNESSSSVDARHIVELPTKVDPHHPESLSISAIIQVGPEYAISDCDDRAAESASRNSEPQHDSRTGTKITTTIDNKTNEVELLKSNELAIKHPDANSTARNTISFHQIDLAPPMRNDLVLISHARYKYELDSVNESVTNHSILTRHSDGGGGESNLEDLFKINISRMFNYNSVDYASQTFDRLVRSWNPLELAWIMMKLNGWPVELSIILLFSASLTNFEPTYFKLNRLFSLPVHGSELLAAEWLLLALVPKQNHMLEIDWLLGLLLLIGRLTSSLMLFSHLHMILKLAARLDSRQLIRKTIETIPVTLCALALALWAPILERVSLMVTPLLFVASSLAIYYLARSIETQFKGLLCPMIFD